MFGLELLKKLGNFLSNKVQIQRDGVGTIWRGTESPLVYLQGNSYFIDSCWLHYYLGSIRTSTCAITTTCRHMTTLQAWSQYTASPSSKLKIYIFMGLKTCVLSNIVILDIDDQNKIYVYLHPRAPGLRI